ncbi:helix-turn-helix transcriptional regulator [Gloeocapsopsis dulcis]|uniref:HTH araC/xylS-type domain-containing protein n=1 Tax=Gloeocapsopsis dulcis AAB1 = 1H9 TaxID=1433147 RepID=A0A6N8FTJ9_9CHRO|nr:AraC family transcriptional regulator [Gloeocapsopsis dulcis]MUL35902.1 hypothetical protein [Gloeocapsopsis dulcis AAB1 = 1H9]WNN87630.1 AraC family transcriptional regulator [Gloeocapsopsis dulcis]
MLSKQSSLEFIEVDIHKTSIHLLEEFEAIYELPEAQGVGYYQDCELCDGLLLSNFNYKTYDDEINKAPDREHSLEFVIDLVGNIELPGRSQTSRDRLGDTGQFYLIGSGIAPAQTTVQMAQQHYLGIEVHIEPELFKNLFCYSGAIPPESRLLFQENEWQTRFPAQPITPAMRVAVQQILHCPYYGLTKRMYLQSKVIELWALILEPLLKETKAQKRQFKLKPEDIDRIYHAKEMLLACLDNPPSLIDLARAVGLNDYKLKIGFRQIFGKTVFGYLHECRLERSRLLLDAGNLTVAGVAHAVGFTNRGDFAAAFRRKFGVNPSVYVRSKQ